MNNFLADISAISRFLWVLLADNSAPHMLASGGIGIFEVSSYASFSLPARPKDLLHKCNVRVLVLCYIAFSWS